MPHQNLSQYFEKVINFIEDHRTHSNVLVHCFAGVSRSATCVIAYLMKSFRWSYQKSFNYVFSRREIINPNPGFVRQLHDYERQLVEEYDLSSSPIKREKTSTFDRTSGSKYDQELRTSGMISQAMNSTAYPVYSRSSSTSNINYGGNAWSSNGYYGPSTSTATSLIGGSATGGGYAPLNDSRFSD